MLHAVAPVFDEVAVCELVFLCAYGVGQLSGVAHGDFLVPAFLSCGVLAAEGVEARQRYVKVGECHGY